MTSLRMRVVEAGARGLAELHRQHLPLSTPEWDDMPDIQRNQYRNQAEAALDAMIAYLTENADEWKEAAYEMVPSTDPDEFGAAALAVLREGDE